MKNSSSTANAWRNSASTTRTRITDADGAIDRILNQLEHICVRDDADAVMSNLLRKFDVVTGLSAWTDPKNYH